MNRQGGVLSIGSSHKCICRGIFYVLTFCGDENCDQGSRKDPAIKHRVGSASHTNKLAIVLRASEFSIWCALRGDAPFQLSARFRQSSAAQQSASQCWRRATRAADEEWG